MLHFTGPACVSASPLLRFQAFRRISQRCRKKLAVTYGSKITPSKTNQHMQLAPALYSMAFAVMLTPSLSDAQDTARQIPLWPNGAPGFENRKNEPEQAKDYWVKNIHNPSITVYLPPKEKATGAAMVVCPGGGHRLLVYDAEGRDAALFLNSIGVAAFVLKYRLAQEENSPYTVEKHVGQDVYRALRPVRHRAAEWGVDTRRVGMLGFLQGGEV